jgi:hypothetical protein
VPCVDHESDADELAGVAVASFRTRRFWLLLADPPELVMIGNVMMSCLLL